MPSLPNAPNNNGDQAIFGSLFANIGQLSLAIFYRGQA